MMTVMSDKKPSLEEAQQVVGGWVEMVDLPDGSQMLVDEDGIAKELPYNDVASLMARRNIVGPALVLQGDARWID